MKINKYHTRLAVCASVVLMMLFVAGCENGKKNKDNNDKNENPAGATGGTSSGSNSGSGTKVNFEVPKFDSSTIYNPSQFCYHCGTGGGKHASNCPLLNIKK